MAVGRLVRNLCVLNLMCLWILKNSLGIVWSFQNQNSLEIKNVSFTFTKTIVLVPILLLTLLLVIVLVLQQYCSIRFSQPFRPSQTRLPSILGILRSIFHPHRLRTGRDRPVQNCDFPPPLHCTMWCLFLYSEKFLSAWNWVHCFASVFYFETTRRKMTETKR